MRHVSPACRTGISSASCTISRMMCAGSHPQDYYGFQMGLMGQSLYDEQAMKDLIAYINTL